MSIHIYVYVCIYILWATPPAAGPPNLGFLRFFSGFGVPGPIPMHPDRFFIEFAAKNAQNGRI